MEQGLLILTGIITAAATSIGAVIAYLNWRNRNQVEVSCQTQSINPEEGEVDKNGGWIPSEVRSSIHVIITNRGQAVTTIKKVAVLGYRNRLEKVMNKKKEYLAKDIRGDLYTTEIDPGKLWKKVYINQNKLIELMGENKTLYCVVYHSMSDKPAKKRIKLDMQARHD